MLVNEALNFTQCGVVSNSFPHSKPEDEEQRCLAVQLAVEVCNAVPREVSLTLE